MFPVLAFIIIASLIIDGVNYFGLRRMLSRLKGSGAYYILLRGYIAVSVVLVIYFIAHFLYVGDPGFDYMKFRSFFLIFALYVLLYVPRLNFMGFIVLQSMFYFFKRIFTSSSNYKVRRSSRRSYGIQKIGLFVSLLTFVLVLYGMIWGKSDFIARENTIYFEDLPKGFEGFKIVQFSDAHLGSFYNKEDVIKGINLIKQQNADVVLFTGDMVNNIADEMENYISDFASIKPKYGKYAILGNHDMGDYLKWKNADIKYNELLRMIDYEQQMGFEMLLNQNKIIYRNGDSIAIVGIENWGKPPFKQYGDLPEALQGVNNVAFKVLLSHDPSHFMLQVKDKERIQLTLSGHTHGMQVGINCCGIKWSPVSFIYKQWNGLYQFADQYLYVNPGFGYIGMAARIGIRPEITVITLRQKK